MNGDGWFYNLVFRLGLRRTWRDRKPEDTELSLALLDILEMSDNEQKGAEWVEVGE